MVYYPIQTLVNAGSKRFFSSQEKELRRFSATPRKRREFRFEALNYTYQEGKAESPMLRLGEYWASGEPICVILGDNIIENKHCEAVEKY